MERLENRKDCGLDTEDGHGQDEGVEPYPCTGRNWCYDNVAPVTDRNHLTRNVRVVNTLTACTLDRKVMNEWMPNGGNYTKEMKGMEYGVWTPS